jgi:glycosyltransferase involved in cell wall biosynthesis
MRILLVSDAWYPQVNGVVRSNDTVARELTQLGDEVHFLTPDKFVTFPCPTYPEIRLAVLPRRRIGRAVRQVMPDAIHIATEGPLGWATRRYCMRHRLPFTTAYHTRFPEYIQPRFGIPVKWSYSVMRRFHAPSLGTMVATQSLRSELEGRGFGNLRLWSRGVDTTLFRPRPSDETDALFAGLPRPIQLYVGRVAVEKNIEAFLRTTVPGSKVVVGDGPQLAAMRQKYPQVTFVGYKAGEDLALHYAAADVFVFPSLTDTFGLVSLEALACGTPVAAFPVPGPMDVLGDAPVGSLNTDLQQAITTALRADRATCRTYAESFSWAACARQFRANLFQFDPPPTEFPVD